MAAGWVGLNAMVSRRGALGETRPTSRAAALRGEGFSLGIGSFKITSQRPGRPRTGCGRGDCLSFRMVGKQKTPLANQRGCETQLKLLFAAEQEQRGATECGESQRAGFRNVLQFVQHHITAARIVDQSTAEDRGAGTR